MRLRLAASTIALAIVAAAFPAAAVVKGFGTTAPELQHRTGAPVARLAVMNQSAIDRLDSKASEIGHDLVDHRRDTIAEQLARRSQVLWHR